MLKSCAALVHKLFINPGFLFSVNYEANFIPSFYRPLGTPKPRFIRFFTQANENDLHLLLRTFSTFYTGLIISTTFFIKFINKPARGIS